MADTQTNGFSLEHPGPLSGPNPFGFADLREAREALAEQMRRSGDNEFEELRGVTLTIDALATASAEMRDERCEMSVDGFCYLADKLTDVRAKIEKWHQRVWQLSIIVQDQDLDALRSYPAYRDRSGE
ncbi:MAG: hypothetical protein AB7O95_13175 [Geminicoccaceae bacterium]